MVAPGEPGLALPGMEGGEKGLNRLDKLADGHQAYHSVHFLVVGSQGTWDKSLRALSLCLLLCQVEIKRDTFFF